MNRLRFLASEITLGSLIAILSVLTALASYQGSMADSEQAKNSFEGMQMLTDANAEYLTSNQDIIQDYTYFDTYYLNFESAPQVAEYYQANFSPALTDGMERETGPFDDEYYAAMYQLPQGMFDEADRLFGLAEEFNQRGDQLQLVMLLMAVGLSFAAWASLLSEQSRMRILFSLLSVITLIFGLLTYLSVPSVVAG